MSVQFDCPICNQPLKAAEADRGRRTRCAQCQSIVTIPSASRSAAPRRRATPRHAPPPMLRSRPQQDDEIDMTPMIDVVFQLLIFFMVTSAFALQKAFPVPTPETTDGAAREVTPVETDADDVLTVRIDADDAVWVEESQAIGRHDLISRLRKARTQRGPGGEPPPRKLQVRVDPEAHHETVVEVLDSASAAGMDEVRLATDAEPQ